MPESHRQEVLNVVLADLLRERGVVAAPESMIRHAGRRNMPDVIVNYQGLRTAIEGEVDAANAREKALASATRRVEIGLAHMGVAVVYPERLRHIEYSRLKEEMAKADLTIAVVSETGKAEFNTGTVDYLKRALEVAFSELIREDVVAEAVELLDTAVDRFAGIVLSFRGIQIKMYKALGSITDDQDFDTLEDRQRGANSRVAGLVLINAMIFHDVLAIHRSEIPALLTLISQGKLTEFPKYWTYILEHINYFSIFHLAREIFHSLSFAAAGLPEAIQFMVDTAAKITKKRAALRHDLMGRVYHRLLAEAKYLGTYYTSIPAATILLKLALRQKGWNITWTDPEKIGMLRIADLSCGTGTLLTAAADVLVDNYVSQCAEQGKAVELNALHKQIAESVLYGYDVLPSAIHLTASTLTMRIPDTPLQKLNLFSLPLGGQFHRLGSIEFLRGGAVQMPLDNFGALPTTQRVTGTGTEEDISAPLPELDLCVMNPPFVRSVGGNLLFGSAPERPEMQERLKRLIRETHAKANITAGLGSVFVAIGDRKIKAGGRLALVLPKALLSGVAWGKTRELVNQKYYIDYVIVSHDAHRWNFSESTDLSEVMLVATRNSGTKAPANHKTVVINLWRNPTTALEALSLAFSLAKGNPPDLVNGQGALSVMLNDEKAGEMLTYDWKEMQQDWFLPCSFAQSDLTRTAFHLIKGQLWLPGFGLQDKVKLCPLSDLGKLGPDRRDIHDGFNMVSSPTPFPTFWGHDASTMSTLAQQPNNYLEPLSAPKPGRHLRRVESLWPLAGTVLFAERMRINTQSIVAIRLTEKVLSNVWWSFAFKSEVDRTNVDKALILWMNSTPGLLILFATRDETEGSWISFKKPSLGAMPVLDIRRLTDKQLADLAAIYDAIATQHLQPFPQMANDAVRAKIDEAIATALDLPDFSILRTMLAREPVVSMQRI